MLRLTGDSQALALPFIIFKSLDATETVPILIQLFLALSCTISAALLALQIGLAEGCFFKRPIAPVPTSSSVERLLEKKAPPTGLGPLSSAASVHSTRAFPHLQKPSLDSDCGVRRSIDVQTTDARMSRISRAMSMAKPHPKLVLLSGGGEEATQEIRHQRSRSFSLSRMNRSDSHRGLAFLVDFSTRLTCLRADPPFSLSLVPSWSRTKVMDEEARPYEAMHHKKRTPSPTPPSSTTRDDYPSFSDSTFAASRRRNFSASVAASSALDYTIDYLSSQILPRLVPSVRYRNLFV
jgi:hypothetical protein